MNNRNSAGAEQPLSLRGQIGQRLVAGFPGLVPDEAFWSLVRDYKVGNIILFQHNIESEAQLTALCGELTERITSLTGVAPFLTIDQEGGVVTRLPDAQTNAPGAMAIAATGCPANAYRMARVTAAALRRCGVNFNLAPDMDVNCNPQNPVIGVRSYGDNPQEVARYGAEAIRGYLDGGVYCCVKHFPGHGDTAVDSHLGLPCIDRSYEQLCARELIPFEAGIAAGVPAVMTTHILFPQLEPKKLPATMSRVLREKLGFTGLIISDCMEMQAIQSYYGTEEGVLAAMGAGVDLVFVSHTVELARRAAERAEAAVRSGALDAGEMERSAARILEHKRRCAALRPAPEQPDAAACRAAVQAVREDSIAAVHLPEGGLPPLGARPLFLGCRDYRSTLASSGSSGDYTFAQELQKLAGFGTALVTPKDPTDVEIAGILQQTKGHTCLVLGTYNGHILRGQLRLAQALQASGLPMIVVALRNPYDLAGLNDSVAALAGWEYTIPMFRALWPVVSGARAPRGVLPLTRLE